MAKWQERAELLFKEEGLNRLKKANVLVVGLGGVGSFAAEFLARAGVGNMIIVDGDVVDMEITALGFLSNTIKAENTDFSILALKKSI